MPHNFIKISVLIGLFVLSNIFILRPLIYAQSNNFKQNEANVYQDSLHKTRLLLISSGVGTAYVASSIGLYNSWYKQYPTSGFHFFNDWNEWQNVDKMGHVFTAYFMGIAGYKLARWSGIKEDKAIMLGAIGGTVFQTTVEIMDGFSSNWGFSISDMGANVLGTSLFVAQQKLWKEQKIQLKFASWPSSHPTDQITANTGFTATIDERANDLYGSTFAERYLKDYNGQSYWLSFNLASLTGNTQIPSILNLSIGYSPENLYGGFSNEWTWNESRFDINESHPRYHQFLLGIDIDYSKIKTKSAFLKTLLSLVNVYKLPMPAIEYNSLGEFKFHLLFTN